MHDKRLTGISFSAFALLAALPLFAVGRAVVPAGAAAPGGKSASGTTRPAAPADSTLVYGADGGFQCNEGSGIGTAGGGDPFTQVAVGEKPLNAPNPRNSCAGLIRFPLAGLLPPGARIDQASVTLHAAYKAPSPMLLQIGGFDASGSLSLPFSAYSGADWNDLTAMTGSRPGYGTVYAYLGPGPMDFTMTLDSSALDDLQNRVRTGSLDSFTLGLYALNNPPPGAYLEFDSALSSLNIDYLPGAPDGVALQAVRIDQPAAAIPAQIRLFNYGPDADLAGWSISGSTGFNFPPEFPLPLARQRSLTIIDDAGASTADTFYTGGGAFLFSPGGGMSLALSRPDDYDQVDFVCWGGLIPSGSNGWSGGCPGAPVPGGWVLRDRDADSDGAADWRASSADDGRTAGMRRPAPLVINEIRAAPGENWIELINPGPSINLRGWSVEVYTAGNGSPDGTFTFFADNIVPSGGALWLAGGFYFGNGGHPPEDSLHRNLLFVPGWGAASPGGEIRLLDGAGRVRETALFGSVPQPRYVSRDVFWSGPPVPVSGYPFTLRRGSDLDTRSAAGWVAAADGSNFGALSPGQYGAAVRHDAAGSLGVMNPLEAGAYGAGTVFTVDRRTFVTELALAGAPFAAPLSGSLVVKQLGGGIIYSAPVSTIQEGLQIFRVSPTSPLALDPGQYAVMLYLNGPWSAVYDSQSASGADERLSFGTVDGYAVESGAAPGPDFTAQTDLIPALWLASLAPPEILSPPALPNAETTGAYFYALTAAGGTAPLAWSVSAGALPAGMSLTAGGNLLGSAVIDDDYSFTLRVTDSQGLYDDQLFTLHIGPGPQIVTSGLPVFDSLNPSPYTIALAGEDGTPPYSWSCTFPPELGAFSCDSDGLLHGTTSAPDGVYSITVNLSDAAGGSDTRVVTMQVYTTPAILTSSLADGFIGISYGIQHLLAAGGNGAGVWSIDASTPLPGGLTLSGADITGTPFASDTEGDYPIRLQYSNGGGAAAPRQLTLTLRRATAPPYWIRRGLTGGELADLAFSPVFAQDRTVVALAANRQSLYLAQDGGFFWKLLPLELPDIFYVEYQIHDTIHNVALPPDFDGRQGFGSKTIVIAADSGLWRSLDLGQTWSQLYPSPAGFRCETTLWFDPVQAGTAYCPAVYSGDGNTYLFRSDDDLQTWTKFSVQTISKIFLSPTFAQDQTMFGLYINENIRRSDDGGLTWKQLGFYGGGTRGQRIEISPNYVNDGTVAFVGMYTQAIYLSTNGGKFFSQTAAAYRPRSIRFPADYDNAAHPWIYAAGEGTDSFQNGCQMMVSRDNGFTLSPTGSGGLAPSSFTQFDCPFFLTPTFAAEGNILVLGSKGSALFRSQDRGELWGPSDSGIFLQAINSVAFAPDFAASQRMFLATSEGIYYSPNGGKVWKSGQFTAPLPADMVVTAIAVAPNFAGSQKVFAYACPPDYAAGCKLIRSTDGGVTWTQRGAVGNYAFFDPYTLAVSPNYAVDGALYVAFYDGGDSHLFRSTDDGMTFTALLTGILDTAYKFAVSPGFATDHRLHVYDYGNYPSYNAVNYKVFDNGTAPTASPLAFPTGNYTPAYSPDFVDDNLSVNDGTSAHTFFWNCRKTTDAGLTNSALPLSGCGQLTISPNYPYDATLFAALEYGSRGLYESNDGGASFYPLSGGVGSAAAFGHINQVALSPDYANDGVVAVATPFGFYISRNYGGSFQLSSGSEPYSNLVTAVVQDPNLPGRLFIGSADNGVALSTDDGITAESITADLPILNPDDSIAPVKDLVIVGNPTVLLAALPSGIYLRTDFSPAGGWTLVQGGDFVDFSLNLNTFAGVETVYAASPTGTSYACNAYGDATPCEGGEWTALGSGASGSGEIDFAADPPGFAARPGWRPDAPSAVTASLWSAAVASGAKYSLDSGASWLNAFGGNDYTLPGASGYSAIKALGINPQSGSREVILGHSSLGLFLTRDGGASWRNVSGPGSGLEATSKNVSALLTTTTSYSTTDILVGINGSSNGGVYLTGDGGEHWTQLNQGFDPSTLNISTLVKTSCNGCPVQYYTGTYGSGVYTRTIAVNPQPTITSWCFGSTGCTCDNSNPLSGPEQGGQGFRLCGANFLALPVVEFDGVAATGCTMVNAGAVTCTGTPPHPPGLVTLRLRNTDTRAGYPKNGGGVVQPYAYGSGAPRAIALTVSKSGSDAKLDWSCPSGCGTSATQIYRGQDRAFTINVEHYNGATGTSGSWTNSGALAPAANPSYFWMME